MTDFFFEETPNKSEVKSVTNTKDQTLKIEYYI